MLKSQRVTLRALRRTDLERQHVFDNDLALHVMRHAHPPCPVSLEQMQRAFDARLGQEPDSKNVWLAIEADHQYIGQTGLMDINGIHGTAELGIFIGDPQHRGIGLGAEAVRLMLGYAFTYHNLRKVTLSVIASNERAIKTYLDCGFALEGRLREQEWNAGNYEDLVMMGILRSEWHARAPEEQNPMQDEQPE